jgi:hypothetical protein
MEIEEYEQACRHVEREFRAKQDYHLAMFLAQDLLDAEEEKRESVLNWLLTNRRKLYVRVFCTIFIRETGGYEYAKDLIPRLDLKLLLSQTRQSIKKSKRKRKQRLLDLYLLYSQALYHFKLQTEFTEAEILCLDPAVVVGQPKYGRLDAEILERFKEVKKSFIRGAMEFSKKNGRGSSEVAEYLMSDSRPEDFVDVFQRVYRMALKPLLNEEPRRTILLLSFVTLIDESLVRFAYGKAEAIIDTIFDNFKDEKIIPQYYLQIKVLNGKFRDIVGFIRREYTEDEINKDPYLEMNLGIARIAEGDIPEGCRLLKEAYVQSGRDSRYLLNYCNALFVKDPVEAMDVIRNHLKESDTPLEEPHVLTLAHKAFVVDVEFSKYLLDYYEKKYLRGEEMKDKYGHYNYLLLRSQYYFHKKDYPKHVSVLENVIEKFPDWPGGYGKLAEFYSDRTIKEHFDLQRAIDYARKNTEIESVEPEYFIGICYANAGEPKKCIKALKEFVNNNIVTLQYINAYQEISSAYFTLGEEDEGCRWAAEWFDEYDCPEKAQLYEGFQIERETQVQRDLRFMEFASGKCRRLSRRIEPVLESMQLWVTSSLYSVELHQERIETERLREEIETLEEELQAVKDKYSKLDLSVEENLETFFDEIEKNEEAQVALLKRMKKDLWQKSRKDGAKLIPKFSKLPKDVQSFIRTSEFSLLANPQDSDFSGVILGYAKAFEVILDENISKPFVAQVGQVKGGLRSIRDHTIRSLFPRRSGKRKLIGVGKWDAILSACLKGNVKSMDRTKQSLAKYIQQLDKDTTKKIRSYSRRLAPSRNGSAHGKKVTRGDALNLAKDFRNAIADLCDIFY